MENGDKEALIATYLPHLGLLILDRELSTLSFITQTHRPRRSKLISHSRQVADSQPVDSYAGSTEIMASAPHGRLPN